MTPIRDVAEILKIVLPETFSFVETVDCEEFGPLPIKRSKGEGGLTDLATRIAVQPINEKDPLGQNKDLIRTQI